MTTKKTTTKTKKTTFAAVWKTLSEIDCSDQVEQKNGFNYLSWAWALEIMMEHFPQHTRENHLNAEEYPCFFDKNGHGMVRVTVKIDDLSRTEDYPVLNYANKSIVDPDSFQVNTALQRGYVKVLAKFGLGHYIYAGEDLPKNAEPFDTEKAIAEIEDHGKKNPAWLKNVLDHYKTDEISRLTETELKFIMKRIKEKK